MRHALLLAPMVIVASQIMAGCGGNNVSIGSSLAGLNCVDDSPNCISKRQATLNYMTNDPTRAWVRQRPTAQAYASGVRLFAFKKKKTELSCAELSVGQREADQAASVLRGPQGNSLSPAQISRGTLLAAEVGRELRREFRRRCKRKA
ncbi:MAG: hypothetical protein RIC14_13385 [Filomicrobium sp.]